MDFRMERLAAALAIAGCLVAGSAAADVLHLKSGDRLTGEVDTITGGKVVLKTDFAGTIAVKLDTVLTVESEKMFDVRTDDGKRVRGQLAVSADTQELRVEDGSTQPLDLAQLSSARQNNLSFRNLGRDWQNRFDAGISASSGNTETASQSYLFESILNRSRSDHRILATFNNQEDDGVKTKEKLDAAYRYRRFFGEKWYGTGSLTYFQDKFSGVDSRWTAGAGAGYQFWDNSMGAFSSDLALTYVTEKLDGIKQDNPAIRWGLDYNRFFWAKKAEVFYTQGVLFIPENSRGMVYNGSAGLRFNLSEALNANFRIDVTHETDPAPDRENTDLTYVIGVGLKL